MPRLFLSAICILLLSGCASSSWRLSKVLTDQTNVDVQIERWESPEDEAPTALHAHPAVVPPRVVQDFLASLHYRKTGLFAGSKTRPVMDESQVIEVAAAISRGLEESKAAERVRFSVQVPGLALGILRTTSTTRGVAFVEPAGVLNMVFDLIGDSVESDDGNDEPTWGNPTRKELSRVQLELPAYVTQYESPDGKKHPLWLTAKLEDVQTPADAAITTTPEPGPTSSETPPAETGIRTPLSDEEVLARLRFLEELKREGRISDEDYEEMREKLLFHDK